jgi:hypothetical protein
MTVLKELLESALAIEIGDNTKLDTTKNRNYRALTDFLSFYRINRSFSFLIEIYL